MLLASSFGLSWVFESGSEKENTSPMDETAQTVLPPEVILVIMFGAYICLGRKTDDWDTPVKLSPKRSNGNLD